MRDPQLKARAVRDVADADLVIISLRRDLPAEFGSLLDAWLAGKGNYDSALVAVSDCADARGSATDYLAPGRNGLELIKDLRAVDPALPILVISMHDESLWAERVFRAGARGYIMRREAGPRTIEAIRRVLVGRLYVNEKVSTRIVERLAGRRAEVSPIAQLSDWEFEISQLIGWGKSTIDIADELHLSRKTVEAHRAKIKEKLDLKTMPELISFASRWLDG